MENVQPGEVLYINLPDRPGTGSIKVRPDAPANLRKAPAKWLNREGIGVRWDAPENDRLISYYELAKDGAPFTKISTGTYYFDVGADAAAKYAVRSVDFDGQTSEWIEM